MKKILVFIFFNFLFLSCKDNYKSEIQINKSKLKDSTTQNSTLEKVVLNKEIQNSEKKIDCNNLLLDFIKSSSLNNPFKESLTIQIEDKNSTNIKLMLYDESNVVGTLLFDAQNSRLLDLTNDIENPEELKFDSTKWNDLINCYFKKNEKYYIKSLPKKEDCVTKNVDMSSEKTCKFKNTTNKLVYQQMIEEKLVENVNTLLKLCPSKNLIQKIGKNGLISNNYLIKQNFIKIEMNYEGGITTISLEQKGNEVTRILTTSAD